MGAQNLALVMRVRLEKERIVHVARRMPGREVELGEIIVVALDVRPFGDGKAHVGEDRDDLVHHLAQRVDAAGLDARQTDGEGHVLSLALELGLERGLFQDRAPRPERFRHLILERIDRRAMRPALVGRELAERREQRGDRALLAERADANGLERRLVARGLDRGERLVLEGGEIGHGVPRSGSLAPSPPAGEGVGQRPMDEGLRAAGRRGEGRYRADPSPGGHSPFERTGVLPDTLFGRGGASRYAALGRCPFACSTIAAKAEGSAIASSDSTLRSTSIPAVASPEINRL